MFVKFSIKLNLHRTLKNNFKPTKILFHLNRNKLSRNRQEMRRQLTWSHTLSQRSDDSGCWWSVSSTDLWLFVVECNTHSHSSTTFPPIIGIRFTHSQITVGLFHRLGCISLNFLIYFFFVYFVNWKCM